MIGFDHLTKMNWSSTPCASPVLAGEEPLACRGSTRFPAIVPVFCIAVIWGLVLTHFNVPVPTYSFGIEGQVHGLVRSSEDPFTASVGPEVSPDDPLLTFCFMSVACISHKPPEHAFVAISERVFVVRKRIVLSPTADDGVQRIEQFLLGPLLHPFDNVTHSVDVLLDSFLIWDLT